jgi:hypothetical protein
MKQMSSLLALLFLLGCFSSCKKNTTVDLNPNVNCANDVILSVSTFSNLFNLLIKSRLDSTISSTGTGMVDGVPVSYNLALKEYTLFFNGSVFPDSVIRSGVIRMKATDDVLQAGSVITLTFQSYYEDYAPVEAIDTIVNMGINTDGKLEFYNHVTLASIGQYVYGGTIRVGLHQYFIADGLLTPGRDITFYLKGTMSGMSSKGYAFSATIRDSLEDALSCPWIRSGIIDVYVPDSQVTQGYIDFVASDGCSDIIWYYFGESSFKVRKNMYSLAN